MQNYINYFFKSLNYIKKNLFFFNVTNKNIRDLAYKNYCYEQAYKKYHYVIDNFEPIINEAESSNYVWICWFQGEENAPDLVKACIASVRRTMPAKKIVVITENNIKDYINLPDFIIEKWQRGIINQAHFSDLLRLRLLNTYGGLWVDSTIYVSNEVDEDFWRQKLFCFKEVSLFTAEELPIRASNWLIYVEKRSNIIKLTEELLLEYWKQEKYATNYHIFHLFFSMASKRFQNEWDQIPTFSNVNNHLLQFELEQDFNPKRFEALTRLTPFHKLNHRISSKNPNSNYSYIIRENFNDELQKNK